jgi:hypothetical protein
MPMSDKDWQRFREEELERARFHDPRREEIDGKERVHPLIDNEVSKVRDGNERRGPRRPIDGKLEW